MLNTPAPVYLRWHGVKQTGAHYGGVLYVDSLSTENGPVPTYIDLLKVTTSTLVQGIKAGKREK